MSELTVASICSAFVAQVTPHAKQLIQMDVVKYINTGDRVKDGVLVIVVTQLVALLFQLVQYVVEFLYLRLGYSAEQQTDRIRAKFTPEVVKMYKYFISISGQLGQVNRLMLYMSHTNVECTTSSAVEIGMLAATSAIPTLCVLENFIKTGMLLTCNNSFDSMFAVLRVYKNKEDKDECVCLINGKIMSNSLEQLKQYMHDVYRHSFLKVQQQTTVSDARQILSTPKLKLLGSVPLTMTFDSMYFEHKPVLLDWISKFKNKTMYPPGLALGNKLGILLYGPPGTGKTGCIRALANELERDILIVDGLDGASFADVTESVITRLKTHIVVLDEFDHLLSREDTESPMLEKLKSDLMEATDVEVKKQVLSNIAALKKKEPVSSYALLQFLDGVSVHEDRVIVATTNNLDRINPVFLRPGRFDVQLELGYCTLPMMVDILKTKFAEEDVQRRVSELEKHVFARITPIVLINKLVESSDVDQLLSKLKQL